MNSKNKKKSPVQISDLFMLRLNLLYFCHFSSSNIKIQTKLNDFQLN